MGAEYFASAPTLVLSPSQPANCFGQPDQVMSGALPPRKRYIPRFPVPPSQNYLANPPRNLAGRKRCIEETDPLDHHAISALQNQSTATPRPRALPSGIWQNGRPKDSQKEHGLSSRKSMKFNLSDNTTEHNGCAPAISNPLTQASISVDQLYMTLGLGWKKLPESQSAAVKGWERYIENHYSLGSTSILLYSEAFNAYLVRTFLSSPLNDAASPYERYYLFQENLSCARLIGTNIEQAIQSLSGKQMGSNGLVVPSIATRSEIIWANNSRNHSSVAASIASCNSNSIANDNDIEMHV